MTTEVTPTLTAEEQAAAQTAAAIAEVKSQMDAQLATLRGELEQATASKTQLEQQNALYQQELGKARAAAPVKQDDLESKFEPEARQFVNTAATRIAEDVVQKAIGRLSLQADVQTKLGGSPELTKLASQEFTNLKQNPYFANQSDEILQALAVERARGSYNEQQLNTLRAEHKKTADEKARVESANQATMPSTGSRWPQPTADDPDADLKHYWAQPESREAWRKMLRDTGGSNVDPLSDTPVRLTETSQPIPAKELSRRMAIRAVRIGSQVGPNLRGMLGGE